jgi:hypothetical protein
MELNDKNAADIKKKYLINMCFANIYTMQLLSQFGFDSLENIKIIHKLNGKKICKSFSACFFKIEIPLSPLFFIFTAWTLGYLINALNKKGYLPAEKEHRRLSFINYQLLLLALTPIIGFISILIGCFIIKVPAAESNDSDLDRF